MSLFHTKTEKHKTRRGVKTTHTRADAKPAIIRQQSNHALVLIGGEKGAGKTMARRQIVRESESQIKDAVDYLTRTAHVKGYKIVKVELRGKGE